uniref:Ig-like domain-containing protein n=1 Tax=Stomoxys calcitrans TaxID=35570 RepID=A0A1I8QB74_STOCA
MRWCSFIGLTRITNKLIRTMVVIILSLSNLESGLSSRVAKEHFEDLRDIILKNRELFLSSENERLKAPISSKMQKATSVLNRLEKRQPINFEQTESVQAIRDVSDTKYNQPVYSNSSTFQKNTLWRPNEKDNKHQMLNEAGENHIPINLSLEKNNSASTPSSVATHFGTENSTVITTQIGATALIPCIVHQIGEGVISWIRKKDYHLLTVGLTTYSSDERFSANHLKHSEDWTLQIKYVQQRDAGIYECQISTHPPTSIFLHLDVVG